MSIANAIQSLEEVARDDLEACKSAIEKGDTSDALVAIERAFAKLDIAIDSLRGLQHIDE